MIVPRGEHCAAAPHVPQLPQSYKHDTATTSRAVGTKVPRLWTGRYLVADDDDHASWVTK